MIERAAEAAFMADWPKDKWDRFGENDHVKNRYRSIARATLEAIREPTRGMLVAGAQSRTNSSRFDAGDETLAPEWTAMVNAALEEKL